MTKKPTPIKPTGPNSSFKVEVGNFGNVSNITKEFISFPNKKEEIENFIAHLFMQSSQRIENDIFPISHIQQNLEYDLDFTIVSKKGNLLLELAEFAPLELFSNNYNAVPEDYATGPVAQFYRKLVEKKSSHQGGKGRILVTYNTHDAFSLCEVTTELACRWFKEKHPNFDYVFHLSPHHPFGSTTTTLFPSELNEQLINYSTERLLNARTLLLKPFIYKQTTTHPDTDG